MSDEPSSTAAKVEPARAEARGSAMDMSKATMNIAISPAAPHNKTAEEASAKEPESAGQQEAKTLEPRLGLAPARVIPKPVQVQSVPDTPVNTDTPANGTPRPELNLSVTGNEAEIPKREDEGVIEPAATSREPASQIDEPIKDTPVRQNGASEKAEMAGALQTGGHEAIKPTVESGAGEKRKLEDDAREKEKASAKAMADADAEQEGERAEKKVKNSDGPVKKAGRPKKDKSAPPVVGKTARKTRSQGPAEI